MAPLLFLLKIVNLPWTETKRAERDRNLKARIGKLDERIADLDGVLRRSESQTKAWNRMKVSPDSDFDHVRKFLDLTGVVFGDRSRAQDETVACCEERMVLMKRLHPFALYPVWFDARKRRVFFLKRVLSFLITVSVSCLIMMLSRSAYGYLNVTKN